MKTTVFAAFLLLGAASAWGQTAPVTSNQVAPLVMMEHPQRATQHELAAEQSLLGSTPYTYAQGEQPLWQFASEKRVTPLGDIARSIRKDHEMAKKAEVIWENN